jgi:hypothetical protein
MNKYYLMFGVLVLLLGFSIAGGVIAVTTTKNVEITYPTTKSPTQPFTKLEMMDFNGISYEVRGNTIILNKKDLFQNREIVFSEEQVCLEWKDENCLKWTNYTKEDFIQQRIKQEIEFVKSVQITRAGRTTRQVDTNGKVLIK